MKILLTGANGYIGKRLLPVLLTGGYEVVCSVRDLDRFQPEKSILSKINIIELDLLNEETLKNIPDDIDGAYYLIHSMSVSSSYEKLEMLCASNFRKAMDKTKVNHVIYLSGIVNENTLSKHLSSRKAVEDELARGRYNFTTLRAGIIIGSGSASFEIIRDLVEKLPFMVAPIWLRTKCQPISVYDVIRFLIKSLFKPVLYNRNFDIGGSSILSYKEMLLGYARVRGLRRAIAIVPVMTPKLSSYWLYFVTSISYNLAKALVSSMKIEVICRNSELNTILDIQPIGYLKSLERTLAIIEDDQIISSWKDSLVSGRISQKISTFQKVPEFGCFRDERTSVFSDKTSTLERIWRIGGDTGWYYSNKLWKIRGFLDKLFGGVGLRRGRTHTTEIATGDVIDFWRVLYANKQEGRLLLYAEMKLPGDAWLEFKIVEKSLYQTATFRPKGLWGRLYWYGLLPVHNIIFKGMVKRIAA